ncbi:phosphoenolpyruvate synthase [Trichonephila clavipes]|nr:phosphoenolpyruvate synthase [Trichonephila clavipes]
MKSITGTKSVLKNLSDKDKDENDIEAIFHADDEKFVLKGTLTGKQRIFQSNKGWDGSLTIDCLNFELNSLKGRGLVINGKITKPSKRVKSNTPLYPTTSVVPLVVHFSEKVCQNPDVTGGKGSSLGKLTELSKDFQNIVKLVYSSTNFQKNPEGPKLANMIAKLPNWSPNSPNWSPKMMPT